MFCRHCGKEISKEAAFCQYCGKQLTVSKAQVVSHKGWERLSLIIHFRKGEAGWVAQEVYPAPLAQQTFWNDAASLIEEIETAMLDEGWQPVGVHGPACVELESYKSAEGKNALAEALVAVASYGTSLLFAKNWKYTMKSITLKWRRPRMEDGVSEEEFHMWLNPTTGEMERWDLDTISNKWYPMIQDTEGNWSRK